MTFYVDIPIAPPEAPTTSKRKREELENHSFALKAPKRHRSDLPLRRPRIFQQVVTIQPPQDPSHLRYIKLARAHALMAQQRLSFKQTAVQLDKEFPPGNKPNSTVHFLRDWLTSDGGIKFGRKRPDPRTLCAKDPAIGQLIGHLPIFIPNVTFAPLLQYVSQGGVARIPEAMRDELPPTLCELLYSPTGVDHQALTRYLVPSQATSLIEALQTKPAPQLGPGHLDSIPAIFKKDPELGPIIQAYTAMARGSSLLDAASEIGKNAKWLRLRLTDQGYLCLRTNSGQALLQHKDPAKRAAIRQLRKQLPTPQEVVLKTALQSGTPELLARCVNLGVHKPIRDFLFPEGIFDPDALATFIDHHGRPFSVPVSAPPLVEPPLKHHSSQPQFIQPGLIFEGPLNKDDDSLQAESLRLRLGHKLDSTAGNAQWLRQRLYANGALKMTHASGQYYGRAYLQHPDPVVQSRLKIPIALEWNDMARLTAAFAEGPDQLYTRCREAGVSEFSLQYLFVDEQINPQRLESIMPDQLRSLRLALQTKNAGEITGFPPADSAKFIRALRAYHAEPPDARISLLDHCSIQHVSDEFLKLLLSPQGHLKPEMYARLPEKLRQSAAYLGGASTPLSDKGKNTDPGASSSREGAQHPLLSPKLEVELTPQEQLEQQRSTWAAALQLWKKNEYRSSVVPLKSGSYERYKVQRDIDQAAERLDACLQTQLTHPQHHDALQLDLSRLCLTTLPDLRAFQPLECLDLRDSPGLDCATIEALLPPISQKLVGPAPAYKRPARKVLPESENDLVAKVIRQLPSQRTRRHQANHLQFSERMALILQLKDLRLENLSFTALADYVNLVQHCLADARENEPEGPAFRQLAHDLERSAQYFVQSPATADWLLPEHLDFGTLGTLCKAWSVAPTESTGKACSLVAKALRQRAALPENQGVEPEKYGLHLALLARAFSKFPRIAACRAGLEQMSAWIETQFATYGVDCIPRFELGQTGILLNAFGRLEPLVRRDAMLAKLGQALQTRVQADPTCLDALDQHDFSLCVVGLARLEDATMSDPLLAMLNDHLEATLRAKPTFLQGFSDFNLTDTLFGFSKSSVILSAMRPCSEALIPEQFKWNPADPPYIGKLANALMWINITAERTGDRATAERMRSRLHELAGFFELHQDRLQDLPPLDIALLLRALSSDQLKTDFERIITPSIKRLSSVLKSTAFEDQNLETIGELSDILSIVLNQNKFKSYRNQTLHFFNDLQPVIAKKINLMLQYGSTERAGVGISEQFFASRPERSLSFIFKVCNLLEGQWKAYNIQTDGDWGMSQIDARRTELKHWLQETILAVDASEYLDLEQLDWNIIAASTTDNPLDALDTFIHKHPELVGALPSTPFDFRVIFDKMGEAFGQPAPSKGITIIPQVDMHGRDLATAELTPTYRLFSHLTNNEMPLLNVQLPSNLGYSMLTRTFKHQVPGCDNPLPFRMDLFGGSRMKEVRPRIENLFSSAPDKRHNGRLLALPLGETKPGTSLEKLARKLLPNKESFYYFQRMMLLSPPSIPGLDPHDHLLQGPFRLAVLPDRAADVQHPFQIGRQGEPPLALRPHDGCGFIRESVALKLPLYQKIVQDQNNAKPIRKFSPFGESSLSQLPSQALQHYPRSDEVSAENAQILNESLARNPEVKSERLYRTTLTGNIQGVIGVAVPSSDNKLYVSTIKTKCFDPQGPGMLIGRSPYDKPNLRPIETSRVITAPHDPTVAFLNACTTLQYSFVGDDKATGRQPDGPDMFFAKGLAIVLPDELWPTAYDDRTMVLSQEDIKTHSQWSDRKRRAELPELLDSSGMLMVCEVLAPGSLVGVPVEEQSLLEGDFDGDSVLLVGNRPALWEHVQKHDLIERERHRPLLKPPKTHTPAIDPQTDHYMFGRVSQIISTQQRLLGHYNTLQNTFHAQPSDIKLAMAQRSIFGIYEGCEAQLRKTLRTLLIRPEVDPAEIDAVVHLAELNVSDARHPLALQLGHGLLKELQAWQQEQRTPDNIVPSPQQFSPEFIDHFPKLVQAYRAANSAPARLRAFVQYYPLRRMSASAFPHRPGYVDDPVQTLENLLSLGMKVGTDLYKSNTSAYIFNDIAIYLDKRFCQVNDQVTKVPYTREIISDLRGGTFDTSKVLQHLAEIPNLAAGMMEVGIQALLARATLAPKTGGVDSLHVDLEQPARDIVNRAYQMVPQITPKLEQVSLLTHGILKNKDHIIKSVSSVKHKLKLQIGARGKNLDEALASVYDSVRYSIEYPRTSFVEQYYSGARALEKQGFRRMRVINSFLDDHAAFAGINTIWQTSDHFQFEVQFHTPESFLLKMQYHDLYKDVHEMELQGATKAQRKQISAQAIEAIARMPRPSGVNQIYNWDFTLEPSPVPLGFGQVSSSNPLSTRAAYVAPLLEQATGAQRECTRHILRMVQATGAELTTLSAADQLKSKNSIQDSYRWLTMHKGLPHEDALAQIDDVLRYELKYSSAEFTDGYNQVLKMLTEVGYSIRKVTNYFNIPDTAYLGINVCVETSGPKPTPFEIQFHTPASLNLKKMSHTAYKRIQVAQANGEEPLPNLLATIAAARKIASSTSKPIGVEMVENFRR